VWTFLGLESEQYAESKGHLHLWGDNTLLQQLRSLLQEFNIRSAIAHWLKNHLPLNTLWHKLNEQDLSWLRDLQPIPELIKQTRQDIALLNSELQQQKQQINELQQLVKQQLDYSKLLLKLSISLIALSSGLIILNFIH
jgi:DNA polymerase sigma